MDKPLFELETLIVTDEGTKIPRVRISVAGHGFDLVERQVRDLHLALRSWVRRQKRQRGETPRGAAELRGELVHG